MDELFEFIDGDCPLLPGEVLRLFRESRELDVARTRDGFADGTGYSKLVHWNDDYMDRIENGQKAFTELDYRVWRFSWGDQPDFEEWDELMMGALVYEMSLSESQRKQIIQDRKDRLKDLIKDKQKKNRASYKGAGLTALKELRQLQNPEIKALAERRARSLLLAAAMFTVTMMILACAVGMWLGGGDKIPIAAGAGWLFRPTATVSPTPTTWVLVPTPALTVTTTSH